jgi:hypothetical protein
MFRRIFFCLPFTLLLLTVAEAQQPKKVPRIGYLSPVSASGSTASLEAFRQGLREAVTLKEIILRSNTDGPRVSLTGFRSLQPNW